MVVTPSSVDPTRLLEEQVHQAISYLLRELLTTFFNTLLSADVDAVCGAGYRVTSETRTNRCNSYRQRAFDTRAGVDMTVPKLREGSYFPGWLLERRKRAERALPSVVVVGYLLGDPTRRAAPPLRRFAP